MEPPDVAPDDATWYIDGSLYDRPKATVQSLGFGIVLVSQGTLLAIGHGVPPHWINDSAGAELWAFHAVLQLSLCPPSVITDCYGIIGGLQEEVAKATSSMRRLARTWGMIAHALDGDFRGACTMAKWMPAHGAAQTIGVALDSSGNAISSIMWRANRLVDLAAKGGHTVRC